MTSFQTQGLDHVTLVVADMERSIAWYTDVLAMERCHSLDIRDPDGHQVELTTYDVR